MCKNKYMNCIRHRAYSFSIQRYFDVQGSYKSQAKYIASALMDTFSSQNPILQMLSVPQNLLLGVNTSKQRNIIIY